MGAIAGFMDGSIWYRIGINVVSIRVMTGAPSGIPMAIAFCQKSIGRVDVGKFSLQNDWYVCTCLPRGNQVDGLPRAASMILRSCSGGFLKISRDPV